MVIAGGDLQCNKVCTFNKVSLHILKSHVKNFEFSIFIRREHQYMIYTSVFIYI